MVAGCINRIGMIWPFVLDWREGGLVAWRRISITRKEQENQKLIQSI